MAMVVPAAGTGMLPDQTVVVLSIGGTGAMGVVAAAPRLAISAAVFIVTLATRSPECTLTVKGMGLPLVVTNDEAAVNESGASTSMVIFASATPLSQYAAVAPQAPQLAGSCCVSTQLFPQRATGQGSQPPFLQASLAAQALRHAPQLSGSLSRFFCVPAPPSAVSQVEKPGARLS